MGDNENRDLDLDQELEKSIEKLINEETGAAKAFVDQNIANQGKNESFSNEKNVSDVNEWKTQVIPNLGKRVVPYEDDLSEENEPQAQGGVTTNLQGVNRNTLRVNTAAVQSAGNSRQQGMDKKTKLAIMGISIGVVILIAAVILIALMISSKEKNSFSYNYSQGVSLYNNGDYSGALKYFEKASDYDSGRKNIELKHMMAECYMNSGNSGEGANVLNSILEDDKYNEKAIEKLVSYYKSTNDGENLTRLVRIYAGTNCGKYVSEFVIDAPTASVKSGSYTESFELELFTFEGGRIYYTIDNNEPTVNDMLYSKPISIEDGELTIKAVSVNDMGVMSSVTELKYVVDHKVPDAPDVTPVSGSYDAGSYVTIENLKDDEEAYYTTDGTVPTKDSEKYVEPFEMPEGNTIVSVVVINKYGLESSVTKRNYIVAKSKSYTFEEAKNLLITRMKEKGDLTDKELDKNGASVNFEYYTKTTIVDEEMYLMYCETVKDGVTTRTEHYFGVNIRNGKIYVVVNKNGTYAVTEY